jgi:hypothetical protein
MSEASQFRQYAEEGPPGGRKIHNRERETNLLDLARTWMQAATATKPPPIEINHSPTGVGYSPTDHHTAR